MAYVVAIDGTACSGKGTITKELSQRLNIISVDTGIIYRSITVGVIDNKIDLNNLKELEEYLNKITIDIKYDEENQKAILDGEDITNRIRTPEVNALVSTRVSRVKIVRDKATKVIREIASRYLNNDKSIIMEGRDITSVIFPDALVKIYVDADVEVRARRRYEQDKRRESDCSYTDILKIIKDRDYADKNSKIGTLIRVPDAIYVDTTNDSIEESCNKIIEIIKEKLERSE